MSSRRENRGQPSAVSIPFAGLAPLLDACGRRVMLRWQRESGGFEGFVDFETCRRLDRRQIEADLEALGLHRTPAGDRGPESETFSGWVGFFGYEWLCALQGIECRAPRDIEGIPDGLFARPGVRWAIRGDRVDLYGEDPRRVAEWAGRLAARGAPERAFVDSPAGSSPTVNCDQATYERIFEQAKEALRKGETYQIKLSIRHRAAAPDPARAFARLMLQRDLIALGLDLEDPWHRQSRLVDATRSIASSLAPGEWLVRWSCAPPEMAVEARPWSPGDSTLTGECWPYVRRNPGQKHLAYRDLLARLHEVDRQSTEVLLVHPEKRLLLEGITSNLLLVEQGRCVTPAEDCLPGLSIALLEPYLPPGLTVSRAPIPIDQMTRFDAIYACGTGRGLIPIVRIPELGWEQRDDSLTGLLVEAYRSLFRSTDDRVELPLD